MMVEKHVSCVIQVKKVFFHNKKNGSTTPISGWNTLNAVQVVGPKKIGYLSKKFTYHLALGMHLKC